ncbi:MAG TPA: phytanoyl-CoA dioxygenase [Planctomycetaceae bacterium]|nr:phytanoyl-CoA dioxygenase [Planctomycetaceae bacterium]
MAVEAEKQTELTQRQELDLRENGFVVLGKLLDNQQLEVLRSATNQLLEAEGENAGAELFDSPHIRHPKESGADRLADLVNKGSEFDVFYSHPLVLSAVELVLGPRSQLSSLNYRAAIPGAGAQNLHADWHEAVGEGEYVVCNSIWLLDDFTVENGATRVVPRTHRSAKLPAELMDDPTASHPEEELLVLPAGSVAVFNAHTWHGGTTNNTELPRRAIHSYFCRSDQPQQLDQKRFLRPETAARLTAKQLRTLGIFTS